VFGFGVPLSPHKAVTLTPWFEASISANLDTVFKSTDISVDPSWVTVMQDPNNPTQTKVGLKDGAVEAAVKNGVSIDSGFYVPMRAGLEADIHVSQTVDFNLYSSLATLGGAFGGASAFTLGAGLSFRWDSIVPAVLPVDRRLEREDCEAVEARFRSCPASSKWLSPEQRTQESKPAEPAATPAPAPAPLLPAASSKPPTAPVATPAASSQPSPPPEPKPSAPSGPPSAVFPN
jgi:hypothetical protein